MSSESDGVFSCPNCKGRGRIDSGYGFGNDYDPCTMCDGTGEVSATVVIHKESEMIEKPPKAKARVCAYIPGQYILVATRFTDREEVRKVKFVRDDETHVFFEHPHANQGVVSLRPEYTFQVGEECAAWDKALETYENEVKANRLWMLKAKEHDIVLWTSPNEQTRVLKDGRAQWRDSADGWNDQLNKDAALEIMQEYIRSKSQA